MSDIVIVAIIGALSSIVSVIVAALVKKWITDVSIKVVKVEEKLHEVHQEINGKMGELLHATKSLGYQEGIDEGKMRGRAQEKVDQILKEKDQKSE